MTRIFIADSFVSALAALDTTSARRTIGFVDKLVLDTSRASLKSEIVHDAADRSIRSLRISKQLRAIAQQRPAELVLLHVAEHDAAYSWARTKCPGCAPDNPPLPLDEPLDAVEHLCSVKDRSALCRLLDAARIDHGLDEHGR